MGRKCMSKLPTLNKVRETSALKLPVMASDCISSVNFKLDKGSQIRADLTPGI